MATNITLYHTGSDTHEVNKALTTIGTYSCELKMPVNVENPEIKLSGSALNANYAYIASTGRYYYLTPLTQNNSITVYQGKSDPLMSFKNGILASPAVISRNSWHFDKYLPDNKMPIEARTASAVLKFPNDYFNGDNNCYILTTIGG